jgi:hypothetical protein
MESYWRLQAFSSIKFGLICSFMIGTLWRDSELANHPVAAALILFEAPGPFREKIFDKTAKVGRRADKSRNRRLEH